MSNGFVLGKFYPPHEGHHYLIEEARKQCDHLTVLCLAAKRENIHPLLRTDWLRQVHGYQEISIRWFWDEHRIDYDDPAVWDLHLGLIRSKLDRDIDIVFSSEEYGPELARRLDAEHVMVDVARKENPISATAIREDPALCWDSLRGPTKAGLTKRIVICGAESSGTTTLAKDLADEFETVWVPEYGRTFSEAVREGYGWRSEDFIHIAQTQIAMENELAQRAGPFLICDTDSVATEIFHELYMGKPLPDLRYITRQQAADHPRALYLITGWNDVPFEQDGLRLFGGKRAWMSQALINLLAEDEQRAHFIVGNREDRLTNSAALIRKYVKFHFTEPMKHGDPLQQRKED